MQRGHPSDIHQRLDDFPVGTVPADKEEFGFGVRGVRHDLGKREKIIDHRGTMDTEFS